jgi:hypothetical protein
MQFQQANALEKHGLEEEAAANSAPMLPANVYPWDFLSPNRDEVLALLRPRDRTRTIWLVAGALVAGFGLGWAGGFGWYGSADMAARNPITQTETFSRRPPETKPGGKTEGARKAASTSGLQTPLGVSTVSAAGPSLSVKPPQATSPGGGHLPAGPSSTASPAIPANERGPMVPVAETRPTTIEGWTVLDVRGGTAVLEGPDGVRMATRGDTVPGIGRIDSIVRWGNRWIVATANGLIATP